MTNVRRYASTVPNMTAMNTSPNITPTEYLTNYKSYVNGVALNSRTALGAGIVMKSVAPGLMGPFPGWGMNTTGYANSRTGNVGFYPEASPQLTVAGTALATPTNLAFSPWGGTGTLEYVTNARATRLLRPMFTKVS